MAGVSTTAQLHCAICIEKFVSIWKLLELKLFVTRKYSYYVTYAVVVACFIIPVSYCSILIKFGVLPDVNFDPLKVTCIYDFDVPFFLTVEISFLVVEVLTITNILILIKVRKLNAARRQQQLQAVRTVLLTIGVYYLCTSPVGAYMVCSVAYDIPSIPIFKFFAHYLILSNSIANFLIYLGGLPRF